MSMPSDESRAHGQAFDARFGEGQRPITHAARVSFSADGLVIALDDGQSLTWPYASLTVAEPLTRRSGHALLRAIGWPGATLFIDDVEFAQTVIAHAPHLAASAQRWRLLKPALAVVAVLAAIAGAVWAFDLQPSRMIARLVPERTWHAAGQRLSATFVRDYPGCTESDGKAALQKIVDRLTPTIPSGVPFDVNVANWQLVNAFAMPGRQLMLTSGLIRAATSPEEIAGVLAHEMGHAEAQHPEAGIVRALGLSLAAKLVLAGASDNIQSMGVVLLQLSYTRDAEREADTFAFASLRQAAVSAEALAGFFERMDSKQSKSAGSKRGAGDFEILSSHPRLADRAAAARAQPSYDTRPILTPAEWEALRKLCGTPAKPAPKRGR